MSGTRLELSDEHFLGTYNGMLENVRLKMAAFLQLEKLTKPFKDSELDFNDTSEQMQAKVIWNAIYQLDGIKNSPKINLLGVLADAIIKDEIPLAAYLRYIKKNVRETNKSSFMPAAVSFFEFIAEHTNQFINIVFENGKILGFSIEKRVADQLKNLQEKGKIPTANLSELVGQQISKILERYHSVSKLPIEEIQNNSLSIDELDFEEIPEDKPAQAAIENVLPAVDLTDVVPNIQMEAYQDVSCETSPHVPVKLDSFNSFKNHKKRGSSSSSSTINPNINFDNYFETLRLDAEKLLIESNQLLHISNQHPFRKLPENDRLSRDCEIKIQSSLKFNIAELERLATKHQRGVTPTQLAIAKYIEQSIEIAQQNCSRYKERVKKHENERKTAANECRDLINDYYKKRCQDYKHYDNVAKIGVFFAQCFKPDYQTDREEIKQFLLKFGSELKDFVATGDRTKIDSLITEGRRSSQSRTSDKNDPAYRATRQYLFDQIESKIGLSQQPAVAAVPSL